MKNRARIVSVLAALGLALLAPAALASVSRNSQGRDSFGIPTASLAQGRPLASAETAHFALRLSQLADTAAQAQKLRLFAGDELRPRPLTVFEASYPETRVGAFDFLGSPLVEVTSGVSHGLHWGCGDSWLGTSEGIGSFLSEDPAGPIDSENRYAFVAWRPHEATDPTGEVAVAIPILLGVLYGINHATSEIDRATAIDPRASLWGAAARGLGRGAVVSAFAYATGGWGGGGAGSLGGALARGAVGGVASGLVTYGAEDVYSRIVQGYALDPSGYVSSGALGGVFGAVGGGFAYRSRSYAIGERMPNGMLAGEGPGAALRNGPEFGRTSGTTKRGLTYELEGGDQRVRRRISAAEVFEDSLAGAYSDIASGRRVALNRPGFSGGPNA
ncbi:MAG: hypothetical protein KBA64_12500 [Armatimonadetes bacterium]|nr:hypothetical protein [Armatimonadota bacterium]